MIIVSWNIQAGEGVDGVVDIERIARIVKRLGSADVICFQEVLQEVSHRVVHSDSEQSANSGSVYPGVDGHRDQVGMLVRLFPGYEAVFGPAVDRWTPTRRLRFGNLILSRLPVLQVAQHKLPQPKDPDTRNMPRQAIEVVVNHDNQLVRVVTTHLEYFSTIQRHAHIEYLCHLHHETLGRSVAPSMDGGDGVYAAGPETPYTVFCGDFNLTVDSQYYRQFTDRPGDEELVDAWRLAYPDTNHAPTCGIYDHKQWPDGEHCRDYFFVSKALSNRVSAVHVDTDTDASDHQPIMLTLSD